VKVRLVTATVLAGGLVASMSGAHAGGAPVLDGKKVTSITTTFSPAAQDHDGDLVTDQVAKTNRDDCKDARCGRLNFMFKPAKGVKGNLKFTINWTVPVEDFDLYVAEVAKDGSASDIGHCGGSAGTSEQVNLDSSAFKTGKTYVLIADYYRATGSDKVTATVAFPAASTAKTTIPATVDGLEPVNCGL
jgi:hypothetical protein